MTQKKQHPGPTPAHKKQKQEERTRDAAMDKTSADSFPTSDPPSSIPNPNDESTTGADSPAQQRDIGGEG